MIWKMIWRVLVVSIGFILAALTCFIILTYLGGQMLMQEMSSQQGGELPESALLDIFGAIAFIFAIYPATTVLPAIIAIVIGEIGRIRSLLYYVLAGGVSSLAIPLLYAATGGADIDLPSARFLMVFATAGFGAGLVYWLFAGRKA